MHHNSGAVGVREQRIVSATVRWATPSGAGLLCAEGYRDGPHLDLRLGIRPLLVDPGRDLRA